MNQNRLGIVRQTKFDIGALPVPEADIEVSDPAVTPTSIITGGLDTSVAGDKDLDEIGMDAVTLLFYPGDGSLTIRIRGMEGYIHGAFVINYIIG